MGTKDAVRTLSIVVPVYNEEEALPPFHQQLRHAIDPLPQQVTVYYVDDGSTDRTGEIVRQIAATDRRVAYVELSRNFGHQAALTAGLEVAAGDAIITLDGDGQHPPELIPRMLDVFHAGCDIVLTQRVDDRSTSFFKRHTSDWFYRFINRIGETRILPGTADYRLLSRQVVEALKQMPEYHRFLRGMIPWLGFQVAVRPYHAPPRLGGRSKYSFGKMARLAADAIFSFSLVPLRIGLSLGVLFFVLALLEVLYVLSLWLNEAQAALAPGWSSLMFMMLIIGSIQMILMGFIGIYIGYIFQEVKRRPPYLIRTFQSGAANTSPPRDQPRPD